MESTYVTDARTVPCAACILSHLHLALLMEKIGNRSIKCYLDILFVIF